MTEPQGADQCLCLAGVTVVTFDDRKGETAWSTSTQHRAHQRQEAGLRKQMCLPIGIERQSRPRLGGGNRMFDLKLRQEFRGKRLKGTAIELANENKTGATQVSAADFLEITYPSMDLLKALEGIGPDQGRPIVFIGERGQGKSHLMGVLYHALRSPEETRKWLQEWADRLGDEKIGSLPLRPEMEVIGESLHRHRYKFLWDLLFERHPSGPFIKGKWEGQGQAKTNVPSDKLILELLRKRPTALLLDEFQTWYDGLVDTKQAPHKQWAFNFIQILSEIAKEHPDLIVLVVSVRSGETEAYQQVHRVNDLPIDFKGPYARRDRQRLLLHRLFENRLQVAEDKIQAALSVHSSEYIRLGDVPSSEQERARRSFVEAWPYAPHLLQLLEDQVLIATDAQETRDLIRILADVFKRHGEKLPVITAAEFRVDDEESAVASLLDSVANQHHAALREKAQRNLEAVRDALRSSQIDVPHLSEIVGSLWLRSLAVENLAGAEPPQLQIDITHDRAIDDNQFQVELSTIVENSFNIHQDGTRLVFREAENPQAKLMAFARNDKLFTDGADLDQLARETRYVLAGADDVPKSFRVVVLRQEWLTDPWSAMADEDRPENWEDRLPLVVLPEEPDDMHARLGKWLRDHVQQRRNTIRFLLPRQGSTNAFRDRDLVVLARAVLKAQEWKAQNPTEYSRLHTKYEGELRSILKVRFDRFAILETWSFSDPKRCTFRVEKLTAQGNKIPEAIEESVRENLFLPEDFESFVLTAAEGTQAVGKVLRELQEPRPNEETCIAWLGETLAKEKIARLCAQGKIAINLRGMEYLQRQSGEDEEAAWKRMRGRLGTGKHLDETYLLLPQAVPSSGGGAVNVGQGTFFGAGGNGGASTSGAASGAGATGDAASGADDTGISGGDAIFTGGAAGKTVVTLSSPATSALNLLGKTEAWGINAGSQIQKVTLKVEKVTGAQLQNLLKKLPDGLTYELGLEKEEDS